LATPRNNLIHGTQPIAIAADNWIIKVVLESRISLLKLELMNLLNVFSRFAGSIYPPFYMNK